MDAIRLVRKELNDSVPIIGFSGSPWTLSTYMVERSATKEFRKVRSIVFNNHDMLNMLTKKLVESISKYLIMKAKAGADVLMTGIRKFSCRTRYSLFLITKAKFLHWKLNCTY